MKEMSRSKYEVSLRSPIHLSPTLSLCELGSLEAGEFLSQCVKANWNNVQGLKSGHPGLIITKGEILILNFLRSLNILNITQFRFKDCKLKKPLPFDFYLPDYSVALEYQGIQHYKPVDFAGKGVEWAGKQFNINQIKDEIKRQYCINNNIKLIEIPYWDFDNIPQILTRELNLESTRKEITA